MKKSPDSFNQKYLGQEKKEIHTQICNEAIKHQGEKITDVTEVKNRGTIRLASAIRDTRRQWRNIQTTEEK